MGDLFCDNLKSARLEAKMTQKEVAEKSGVAKSTYSLYESGKREPSVDVIKRLAKVLNVPTDVLLGIPQSEQILFLTSDDTALLVMYKELNQIGRRKVMEYVSDLYDRYKKL